MGKLSFLTGAAVGYVLGARAGRNRYEQIKSGAQKLWHNPKVQHKVSDAEDAVRARAPHVGSKVKDAAGAAVEAAGSRIGSDGGTGGTGGAGEAPSDRHGGVGVPPTARGDDGRPRPDDSGPGQ